MARRENESTFFDDYEEPDELRRLVAEGKLPASAIVTGAQLTMRPGQSLADKARELGTTQLTLRRWHLEWRGSGYDPEYIIRRSTTKTAPGKWYEKDWVAVVRDEIARGTARHIGDVLFAIGLGAGSAQSWSNRHSAFEQALWKSGVVSYPAQHWRNYIAWIRGSTIEDYRQRKAEYMAKAMPEVEAGHVAADEAVADLKHKTRQRRRVERDTLLGIGGHEELLRRYRKGGDCAMPTLAALPASSHR